MTDICRNCGRKKATKEQGEYFMANGHFAYEDICLRTWGGNADQDCANHTIDWFARAQQNQLAADAWDAVQANKWRVEPVYSYERGHDGKFIILGYRAVTDARGFSSEGQTALDAVLQAMKVGKRRPSTRSLLERPTEALNNPDVPTSTTVAVGTTRRRKRATTDCAMRHRGHSGAPSARAASRSQSKAWRRGADG